ncbi:hypothetical protein QW131_33640 [Roseibium salinum]|nr:hypothetical protein [Roseibium salinum]
MNRERLVRKMVDRDLEQLFGHHLSHASDEVLLSARGLTLKKTSEPGGPRSVT